jgi:hypothetical protein
MILSIKASLEYLFVRTVLAMRVWPCRLAASAQAEWSAQGATRIGEKTLGAVRRAGKEDDEL